MRASKKIGCLIICLAMLFTCLTSCDIIGGKIDPDKYQANVRIAFATNDDNMKGTIDAMSSSSVIMADGDNISLHTTANSGDTSVNNSYVLLDGVLYHHLLIISGDYSAESTKKANVDEESKDDIISKAGTGADIGLIDFETSEMYIDGGLDVYSCSDITSEAKDSLENILTSDFSTLGATVSIKEAYYTLEMKDGVEMGSALSVSFEININGKVYEVTMHVYTDYDYSADVSITLPTDSEGYETVSYDKIIK